MKHKVFTPSILLLLCVCVFGGFVFAQTAEPGAEEAFYEMTKMAPREYSKGNLDKARSIAGRLLKEAPNWEKNWNYGNAIQAANIVLGRIAMGEGDVDRAKKHLLAAGRTPGSPQLNSFGPDMTLASEFLAHREKDVVLEYFDLCAKFWNPRFSKLDEWRKEIRAGNMPQFGANLRYIGF